MRSTPGRTGTIPSPASKSSPPISGAIENGASYGDLAGDRGVGTHGGSQDHTAILCAVPGHVVGYRFGPVRREASVPLGDRVFVIGASGITASKAGEHRERYNQAVDRCRRCSSCGARAPVRCR